MQGVLACIDANGVNECSGYLMGRFGAGARPVHPILRLWPQEEPTVTSTDGRHLAVFFLP